MDADQISALELGRRLKNARESADIKQSQAAEVIGVARTTLVAMEKGERRVRIEELQSLARLYGVSANALLRREAVHIDLMPRFRRLSDTDDPDILEAARLLNQLVAAEVELENLLGVVRVYAYPPQRPLRAGDVVAQAEEDAQDLRQAYGLGSGAIPDIWNFIELTLGIRLYQRRLPSKISGLFTYDRAVGAAILLNANHPAPRRRQSAAHELGHFVATRDAPEVLEMNERFTSREERYANAFARAFLTPASAVKSMFEQFRAGGETHLTRRIVILMADHFSVSVEAMVKRLEALNLAPAGSWDWFQADGGISDADVLKVLKRPLTQIDEGKAQADQPFSPKIGLMAYRAWKRDLLTEGQLSDLLSVDRPTLRAFLYDLKSEDAEADDVLKLPQ